MTCRCLYPGRKATHCHVSHGTGSVVTYTFEGDMITGWKAAESINILYTVSIDGFEPESYSSFGAEQIREGAVRP
ncbi:hypothetical protein FRC04_005368 [Tulasnella sp. 424]|nr:hypothetical protein FRC04_005368 [Tulasnella sp. 424]KAG8976474.1 hypothetical protein FRC05_003717 [Tulasnella sp. 425]